MEKALKTMGLVRGVPRWSLARGEAVGYTHLIPDVRLDKYCAGLAAERSTEVVG